MSLRRRERGTVSEKQTLATAAPARREQVTLTLDDLTPVETQAASLGVHPDALKPIAFLNQAHYEQLSKTNAISNELAQRLAAFQQVAEGDAGVTKC